MEWAALRFTNGVQNMVGWTHRSFLRWNNCRPKMCVWNGCMQISRCKMNWWRKPSQKSNEAVFWREMTQYAIDKRGVSVALGCRAFAISQRCFRYVPLLADENEEIKDWLIALTKARKNWGFGLCYLYLRNIKGFKWSHKRVRRIYCELELNLRIKPRKRLKRERLDPLSVLDKPNYSVAWKTCDDTRG